MKVRLTADMLRLRLNQADVDALSASGRVGFSLLLEAGREESGALQCVLRIDTAARAMSASFIGRALTVTLPAEQANRWIASNAISLEGTVGIGDVPTRILVEKDLGCRHADDPSDASTSQTFDHLRE
jgi:hypothetical protein